MAKAAYNELDYASAVTRVRAMERHMLDRTATEKLLSASTLQDALRTLADLGWNIKDGSGGAPNQESYEQVIERHQSEIFSLLYKLGAQPFLDIIKIKYDYHNIKVLIKSELTQIQAGDITLDMGNYPVAALEKMMLNRDYRAFNKNMKSAIAEAYDVYTRSKDVQQIDILLDAATFRDQHELHAHVHDALVIEMLRTQIDIYNIKTYARLVQSQAAPAMYRVIVEGGFVKPSTYAYGKGGVDKFDAIFAHTPYADVFAQQGNLELLLDNKFNALLRKTRMRVFGLAPLVAYYYYKETELINIRIILTCKKSGIPSDEIRRRLRNR